MFPVRLMTYDQIARIGLQDRLTHHVHILEMNGDSYRLKHSRENAASQAPDELDNP